MIARAVAKRCMISPCLVPRKGLGPGFPSMCRPIILPLRNAPTELAYGCDVATFTSTDLV
jgi:hypothetical protein